MPDGAAKLCDNGAAELCDNGAKSLDCAFDCRSIGSEGTATISISGTCSSSRCGFGTYIVIRDAGAFIYPCCGGSWSANVSDPYLSYLQVGVGYHIPTGTWYANGLTQNKAYAFATWGSATPTTMPCSLYNDYFKIISPLSVVDGHLVGSFTLEAAANYGRPCADCIMTVVLS